MYNYVSFFDGLFFTLLSLFAIVIVVSSAIRLSRVMIGLGAPRSRIGKSQKPMPTIIQPVEDTYDWSAYEATAHFVPSSTSIDPFLRIRRYFYRRILDGQSKAFDA
jgi:hypothetical protein